MDIPGIDDFYWVAQVREYILENVDSFFPMVLIDSSQGTAKLSQFDFIKEVMQTTSDLDSLVVFTKFMNGKNDMVTKLGETEDLDSMEDSEYQQFVIEKMATQTVQSLQSGLRQIFPSTNFFFFDPAAGDVYIDKEGSLAHESAFESANPIKSGEAKYCL